MVIQLNNPSIEFKTFGNKNDLPYRVHLKLNPDYTLNNEYKPSWESFADDISEACEQYEGFILPGESTQAVPCVVEMTLKECSVVYDFDANKLAAEFDVVLNLPASAKAYKEEDIRDNAFYEFEQLPDYSPIYIDNKRIQLSRL